MSEVRTCGHCGGTGTCTQGDSSKGRNSCDSCREAAGKHPFYYQNVGMVVKCSVCGGSGWVKVG